MTGTKFLITGCKRYCIGPTKAHYLIVIIIIIWATRVCPVLFYDMTIALWSTPL